MRKKRDYFMSLKKKMANLSLDLSAPRLEKGSRKFFTRFHEVMDMPNLIEAQLRSYKWFWEKGLKELFAEINSIKDFTGKNLELLPVKSLIELISTNSSFNPFSQNHL